MPKKPRKVLISGSRYATREMLNVVCAVLHRIRYYADELIVGDAHGIDAEAVRLAEQLNVPYTAFGIWNKARNGASSYVNVWCEVERRAGKIVGGQHKRAKVLYTHRDRFMVEQADIVVCIWNGTSTGTKAVYDYALELGKDAVLRQPGKARVR